MGTVYKTYTYKKLYYFNDFYKQVACHLEKSKPIVLLQTVATRSHNIEDRIVIGDYTYQITDKLENVKTNDIIYIVQRDDEVADIEVDYKSMAEAYKKEAEFYKNLLENQRKKKSWFGR